MFCVMPVGLKPHLRARLYRRRKYSAAYRFENSRWNSSTHSQVRRPRRRFLTTRFHIWSKTTSMPNVRSSAPSPETS